MGSNSKTEFLLKRLKTGYNYISIITLLTDPLVIYRLCPVSQCTLEGIKIVCGRWNRVAETCGRGEEGVEINLHLSWSFDW